MGGLPLKPEMRNLIIKTWRGMRKDDDEPVAKEVREELSKIVELDQRKYGKLPELRTFQEILREARKKIRSESIDEEWTMASLTKHDLPAEAIPYVTKVWRYAVNTDESFTVMQAKWVVRLYHLWDDDKPLSTDITRLWYYSGWYADIERNAILAGDEPSTFSPDTLNLMTNWETMTIFSTGYWGTETSKRHILIGVYRPLPTKQGEVVEELLHFKNISALELFELLPDVVDKYHRALFNSILDLPSLSSLGFDYDTKMVYLRLYTSLIKLPGWNSLPPIEAVDLIVQLRNWVIATAEEIRENPKRVQLYLNAPWPIDIFSKAGYELANAEE